MSVTYGYIELDDRGHYTPNLEGLRGEMNDLLSEFGLDIHTILATRYTDKGFYQFPVVEGRVMNFGIFRSDDGETFGTGSVSYFREYPEGFPVDEFLDLANRINAERGDYQYEKKG